MTIFQAIILGLIQGLGEFLPISSSGHLILTPWLFGWQDPGLSFDVALHVGTLLAVIVYFFQDWLQIFQSGLTGERVGIYSPKILWILVLASLPGALAGLFFEDQAETIFRQPLLIAATLSIVGGLLYLADKYATEKHAISQVSFKDGLLVGLAQAVAIIPGVSRSGSTITSALALGYDKTSAARFSFLLSTPIIFGAAILKLDDFFANGIGPYEIVGVISAAVSGYLAIAWLLKFIKNVSYKVFFWYRLALAILIVMAWSIYR